jgi:hypothetical protein
MITTCAINQDGNIYTGDNHSEIIRQMIHHGHDFNGTSVYGFVTDNGIFMNRQEAYQHAFECGQVWGKCIPELYSQDLKEV